MAVYHNWLYDNQSAWQKTISDSRWSYDMPISRFMAIYAEYRGMQGITRIAVAPIIHASSTPAPMAAPLSTASVPASTAPAATASGGVGQILSQNEIDSLLNQMSK